MPVNSKHPQYKEHIAQWIRCRDAVAGQDAIKAKEEAYLPKLSGHMSPNGGSLAYSAYLGRTLWFGASDRTVNGYVGAIMRKEPSFKVPSVFDDRLDDITNCGETAVEFSEACVKELIVTGRYGLLIDKPEPNELPCIKIYYPENILNWQIADGNLVGVQLEEHVYEPKPDDHYELQDICQVRELLLENGQYICRIWRKADTLDQRLSDQWVIHQTMTPTKRGTALESIPFILVSCDKDATSCSKPPILDLVDANINHFQLDADYRHGLHFTALPTPVFTGVDENRDYYLGSEMAINLRNDNSKAFYLEFLGTGLTAIKDAMEERKQQMAALGAQLLTRAQRGRGVETAEAARIQQSGETSLLAAIVSRTEEALEKAIYLCCDWETTSAFDKEEIEVTLNRDFIDATLTAQEIIALNTSWQNGGLSHSELFWNLQRGGVIRPNITYEEYCAAQEQERKDGLSPAAPSGKPTPPVKAPAPASDATSTPTLAPGVGTGPTGNPDGPTGGNNKEAN